MKLTDALQKFISARPGFDFANYGDIPAYRADVAEAGRQLNDARALLRYIEQWEVPIPSNAFISAFGGRLSWDGEKLDYCAGQYYPLEYRAAVAAVLANAIWQDWAPSCSGPESIRKSAKLRFGKRIASKYFS